MIGGLQKALDLSGGTHTLKDVMEQIAAGDAQLWTADDAVIVTEVHQTPRKRVLHFWLAAGELKAVIRLSRKALEWGRDEGCEQASLIGRRGWEKALASEGWTARLSLMGRTINV